MATGEGERGDRDTVTSAPSNNRASHARPRLLRSQSILASSFSVPSALEADGGEEPNGTCTSEASKSVAGEESEDAWTQAYCNVAVLVRAVIEGCICWAVYCVLESFLRPLLWAILIGTILHPIKKAGTYCISRWLDGLVKNCIPLSVGIVLLPLYLFNYLFNYLSTQLESAVGHYWWAILGSVVGVASLWMLHILNVPLLTYQMLSVLHSSLQSAHTQLAAVQVTFRLLRHTLIEVWGISLIRAYCQECIYNR